MALKSQRTLESLYVESHPPPEITHMLESLPVKFTGGGCEVIGILMANSLGPGPPPRPQSDRARKATKIPNLVL